MKKVRNRMEGRGAGVGGSKTGMWAGWGLGRQNKWEGAGWVEGGGRGGGGGVRVDLVEHENI